MKVLAPEEVHIKERPLPVPSTIAMRSAVVNKPVPVPPGKGHAAKPVPIPPKKEHVVQKPVPVPPGKKNEERVEVTADFDGRSIPNAMSCVRGEQLVVVEKTSTQWWDCRNDRNELGFVPAGFLRPVQSALLKKLEAPVVVMAVDQNETVAVVEEFGNDDEEDDRTMEVPLLSFEVEKVEKPTIKKKPLVAPQKAAPIPPSKAPLAAPIPGTPFRADFPYEPMGDTEIGLKVGDLLIAPVGADLDGEWLFVLNRRSAKKGFVPRAYVSNQ